MWCYWFNSKFSPWHCVSMMRIIHLHFLLMYNVEKKAMNDTESTYLKPKSFLTNSPRLVCEFQFWKIQLKVGEKEILTSWNNPLPWISMCSPVPPSLPVIAWACLSSSGQWTVNRSDRSHFWAKATWSQVDTWRQQMTELQGKEDSLTRMELHVSEKWVLIMKNNWGFVSSDGLA